VALKPQSFSSPTELRVSRGSAFKRVAVQASKEEAEKGLSRVNELNKKLQKIFTDQPTTLAHKHSTKSVQRKNTNLVKRVSLMLIDLLKICNPSFEYTP